MACGPLLKFPPSLQNLPQPIELVSVGRLRHKRIGKEKPAGHGAGVGEALESGAAAVAPHPAGADTAEGQIEVGGLLEGVVEADRPRLDRGGDSLT